MAIRQIFKISRKTFLNPRGWLDYDYLKDQNKTIIDILRNLFSRPQPVIEESFEQAQERLNLTDEDIALSIKNYRLYTLIFFIFGALIFFYAFYLLFRYGSFLDWLLGMGVATLFLSQAFKYDFWSLQMRRRTLGLNWTDWKNHILGEKDAS